jgi:Big-like domain-containing protein
MGRLMRRPTLVSAVLVGVLACSAAAASPAAAGLLPVAVNDSYTAVHGKLKTVGAPGVLGNDLQLGSGFKAKRVNDVDNGTLDLKADGSFTYRSKASFVGTDTFTYRVDGGILGLSNIATVTISVTNDAPVARPDAYTAVADVDRSIPRPGVLGNDDDADGDHLTIDVVQEPAHGNLDEHDDGSFKYKADKGFSGNDTWSYRVWDGIAWSNTVTVTMTVSLPATPKPTPAPTPQPTPQPTPTTTPRPTPRPTVVPLPTLPPLPTIGPLPSVLPQPTPTRPPTPKPSRSPSPPPTASPSATATAPSTDATGGTIGPGGPISSARPSPNTSPAASSAPSAAAQPPFTLPSVDDGGKLEFDTGTVTFESFEWAVPALVLTVPGILIVIAVLAQALIGLAWLPIARRWLGGDRRRRRVRAAGSAAR